MGQQRGGTGSGSRLMRSSPRQPGSLLPIRDTGAPPVPAALPRVDNFSYGSDACVQLSGEDGNAFAILGRTTRALGAVGLGKDEIDQYYTEDTAGD
jgi:hypothetical protein